MLPPATIYTNPARALLHECSTCLAEGAARPNTVRSEFGPVLCFRHRNNADGPDAGWIWATATEHSLINLLRANEWTEEGLAELVERAHQEELERVSERFE